jgi:hypothetical protein
MKNLEVKAAQANPPQNLAEALQWAQATGILEVPAEAVQLTIDSGVRIEVSDGPEKI